MMVGVVILLQVRDDPRLGLGRRLGQAAQPHARRDRQVAIYAVLAGLGLYTLYASWTTLLELAIGIAAVGAVLAGLYVVLGRKLQRALGVFFGGFLRAHVRPDAADDAAVVPGLARPHGLPDLGPLLDLLVRPPHQRSDPAGAARLDRRLAQAQRARVHHHGRALADARHGVPRALPRLHRRSSTSCCCR